MNIQGRLRELQRLGANPPPRPPAPARWEPRHFEPVPVPGPPWAPMDCVGVRPLPPYASELGVFCRACERTAGRLDDVDCSACMPARWATWTLGAGHMPWHWHNVAARHRGERERVTIACSTLARHGLLLWGPTASGKSHLAALLVWHAALLGRPVLWLAWDALCRYLVRSDDLPPWMRPDAARLLRGLVVLDDLGAGRQSEWQQTNLVQLLDALDTDARLVVTTNLGGRPGGAFDNWVGPRAASRIRGRCQPVELTRDAEAGR